MTVESPNGMERFGEIWLGEIWLPIEGWFWERKRKRVCVVDGFIYFTSSILFFMLTGTLVLGASSCSQ